MNGYHILVLGTLVLCSIVQGGFGESDFGNTSDDSVMISLEREMCFGYCPVYTVTLHGNGTTNWFGEMYVDTEGNASAIIDPSSVLDLYNQLAEEGIFELNDSYTEYSITDMPYATITVKNATMVKQIKHYHGDMSAPQILTTMEDAIDMVANTSIWIGTGNAPVLENGEAI